MNIIGIGTDIIEVLRISRMIERHGELFLRRVYTEQEIQYCSARGAASQHYAGRWAAKEAVLKALGTGWSKGIHWTDIEIQNDPSGQPTVRLSGAAGEISRSAEISEIHVSISHCRTFATALAIAVG